MLDLVERIVASYGERSGTAAGEILARLCERLATLVGDSGIAAVLHRAWKDTLRVAGPDTNDGAAVLPWAERAARVGEHVGRLESDRAAMVARAVVIAFVATVCTFIGERLTERLMGDLWPELLAKDNV